jgi:hypothetical protein
MEDPDDDICIVFSRVLRRPLVTVTIEDSEPNAGVVIKPDPDAPNPNPIPELSAFPAPVPTSPDRSPFKVNVGPSSPISHRERVEITERSPSPSELAIVEESLYDIQAPDPRIPPNPPADEFENLPGWGAGAGDRTEQQ